ncbi:MULTISPECIES: AzlC family ABC transporter permease [Geobacillus]|jgi:4-azaleucine resistance transporter AzlC|uniref:Branched-chain amino acid transporter n=2 Tax=Geobacillus thermodenitrificans TaxID=33940 RepID=A4IKV8_GEOTN|nr:MULTISPECIES: AzlC family ABC transporter permease [Geobacillus]ABO65962.1 Branched-chain amino acid transporter [Geobacillus thermodenitrificans NG80-2]ARA97600.1 branched-chain amino acid ABC transporter permease [Geobacillus thermodenitrificans]ARP41695.1 putative membrane protein [Geobacillus thermodenitrificans]ATO36928.1 branched-chain amino acid ABC transporter permease [Geobacillus thermodenitrificans]KQB94291.1 branched-chain amino acid ABC transporter permease [Geobacillus sp. PA-
METTWTASKMAPFRQGMQAGVAIAIGYMPIALTFGLLAKTTGLTLAETVLMSVIVFAGASQYIALSLLSVGTGIFEIILTTFILNIRHFLMSASLSEKAEPDELWKKALYAFGITDETFSVAAMKEGTVNASYMFGLIMMAYGSWVVNSGIGYAVGKSLPESLQDSMSVALYAMFIGLLVPALKKQRKTVWLAGLAAVFNSLGTFVFHLSKGWSIVLATLLSAVVVQWLAKEGGNKDE